jgi:drug/metabolite transporter (DMT)-like permease
MSKSPRANPAIAPWAFVLLWSSGAIFTELGLRYARPLPFLAMRALIACSLGWAIRHQARESMPTRRSEWTRVAALGLVMQAGYQYLFFQALDLGLPAGILAVILGAQPLLTAALTQRRHAPWGGLVVGLAGLALVVGLPSAQTRFASGALAGLGALLCLTTGTLGQRRLANLGVWTSLALQQTSAALVFTTATLATGQAALPATVGYWSAVAWMAIVVSTGATGLLVLMTRTEHPTRVASLFYLVPPVTALLDLAVYHHTLTWPQWAGMTLTTLALANLNRTTPRD